MTTAAGSTSWPSSTAPTFTGHGKPEHSQCLLPELQRAARVAAARSMSDEHAATDAKRDVCAPLWVRSRADRIGTLKSSVGHARDSAQISRLRRGLWWVTRAVIAGGAGMRDGCSGKRGVVSTGGSRVALAWLADREPSPDRSGLWPAGGGTGGAAWRAGWPAVRSSVAPC